MTDIQHMTMTIPVHLDLHQDGPALTILDNPHVPKNTVATITWIPTPNSVPFNFAGFEWEKDGDAVIAPSRLETGMTTLARNRVDGDAGDWPYRLAVTTREMPNQVIWSSGKGTTVVNPIPDVRNILARLRVRVGRLSAWIVPGEEPSAHEPAKAVVDPGIHADPSPGAGTKLMAAKMANPGPMIIMTPF